MKKQKKKKKKRKAKKASPTVVVDDMMAAAVRKFGANHLYAAAQHDQRHVGLPLPSLALEYLLSSRILYLGSLYGLAGKPQSFKSTLGLEFARILVSAGGVGCLCETEGGKISPTFITSILGGLAERIQLKLVESVEEAQDYMTWTLDWYRKKFRGHNQLFGLFLDSLNGSSSWERHKNIVKKGHVERGYPIEALLWSRWLQDQSPKLAGWPAVLIFVNHLKKPLDSLKSYRHVGGDAQDFYSTVYFHVARVRDSEGANQDVTHLSLKVVKHSFGKPKRKIDVPFVGDRSVKPTRFYFDWGHATAHLLVSGQCPDTEDVLSIDSSSSSIVGLQRTFSCKQLGLKDVPGRILGAAIHEHDGIMNALREVLGIEKCKIWEGVMPVEPVEQEKRTEVESQTGEAPFDTP